MAEKRLEELAAELKKFRYAIAHSDDWTEVAAYLPMHYKVQCGTTIPLGHNDVREVHVIAGKDNAGWTLEGYVIPRLGSGLIHCEEISASRFLKIISD